MVALPLSTDVPCLLSNNCNNSTPRSAAVAVLDGPLLVLAGPGSGKTSVITHRIVNLIRHGIPSQQIVALTFTNKAADEMKNTSPTPGRQPPGLDRHLSQVLCTVAEHLCAVGGTKREFHDLRYRGQSRLAMRDAFELADLNRKQVSVEVITEQIAHAKHNAVDVESYQPRPGNALDVVIAKVYRAYAGMLLQANAVDFDDLLLHTYVLLRDNAELRASLDERFRYMLVDEYQDTNACQYAIVRALSIDHRNLCCHRRSRSVHLRLARRQYRQHLAV